MRVLRRNWRVIAVFTILGVLIGGLSSVVIRPQYTAETQLFVATQTSGSVQDLQMGSTFVQARVSSYVKTVKTPMVLQPAIDELGLDLTPQQLAEKIEASSDLKTVLITIGVDDESPVQAAAIAKAVANSLIKTVDDLEKPNNGGPSPVRVSIVAPASAPVSPSSPNLRLNLAFGFGLGLMVGVGLALLRSTLDNRVRSQRDIENFSDAPVLAGISFDQQAIRTPLIVDDSSHSIRAESFRQLRTNLQFAHVSHKSKTVLITSSVPGEGKSTTATNLALSMAEAGHRVALVDADLRRPMVATYLDLEGQVGLTTALVGEANVLDLLQPWGQHDLHVLTSGRVPPNPSELLGSNAMKALIETLESNFDSVIIDAPPLLPVTDAAVLAQGVGGVILVVGCHTARQPEVEKSLTNLELVNADLLGIVLNRVSIKGPDAYSYGYYGYSSIESEEQSKKSDTALKPTVSEVATHNNNLTDEDFDNILSGRATRASRRND